MYFVIEGIDCVGKSTQIELLKNKILDCVVTKEPGATQLGSKIREMLLGENDFSKTTELLLFLADRAEHIDKVIKKNRDKIVISDRSLISGIAYAKDFFDIDELIFLNKFATQNIMPNKVVLIQIDKNTLIQRVSNKEQDYIEKRGVDYLISIQNNLLEVLKILKIEILIVDANESIDVIHQKIYDFFIKG